MEGRYNTRSPAVKRLMREAQELSEPTDQYYAQPLEDNLFEWHFTVRGPVDSDFEGGIYHGRIILPVDYPMKPPSIIWLTPNGRFETNKKICLSISGHHPESWQPSWSIRTALLAIIGFMPTHPGGAIGSLDYKPEERKVLAKKSRDWKCPTCGEVTHILLDVSSEPSQASQEAKELASQIAFQGEKPACKEGECPIEKAAISSTPVVPSTTESQGTSNNSSVNASTSVSQNFLQASMPQPPFQFFPPGGDPSTAMPGAYPFPNPYQPLSPSPWGLPGTANSTGERDIASMVPRFPYPPSHYPGGYSVPFYPPGLAPPRGVGMFPCPYPPPFTPRGTQAGWSPPVAQNLPIPISVNNSSDTSINAGQASTPKADSPMASPVLRNPPTSPASGGATENNMANTPPPSPIRMNVLNELLAKVKRIGSDELVQQGSSVEVDQLGSSVDLEPTVITDPSYISQMTTSTTEEFPTTRVSSFMADEDSRTYTDSQAYHQLLNSQTMTTFTQGLPVMEASHVFSDVSKAETLPVVEASHVFSHVTNAESTISDMGDEEQSVEEKSAISQNSTAIENQTTEEVEDKIQVSQLKPPDIIPTSQLAADVDELQLLSTISEARETEKSSSTISEQEKQVSSEERASEAENVHKSQVVQEEGAVESANKPEVVGDGSEIDDGASKKQDSAVHDVTDSGVSHSLKKESVNELTGAEMSHSELLSDAEENSGAGAPPIEASDTEQRSNFEKSTSSSMSDLQKMRKHENVKSLRQRQSATARVPQEVGEDNETQELSSSAPGHRIEAASGDTTSRNQRLLRPGVRALNEARLVHREALAQVRQRHSPYDASFLLMVGLFVATVFIILNRVFSTINWSDISFSEFY